MKNLVRKVVAVLDKSVPEWIVDACRRGLQLSILPQQEINHLPQQSFRRHLPDDPVEQGCWGQDANLRPVHKNKCVQKNALATVIRWVADDFWLTSASTVAP